MHNRLVIFDFLPLMAPKFPKIKICGHFNFSKIIYSYKISSAIKVLHLFSKDDDAMISIITFMENFFHITVLNFFKRFRDYIRKNNSELCLS